jgi:hypothetical protein
MTPSPDTLERELRRLSDALESLAFKEFMTDEEIIRRLGVPAKIGSETLRMLDANPRSGFPPKQKLWGDRRNWRDVLRYFERVGDIIGRDAARLAAENRDNPPRLPRHPALRSSSGGAHG